MAMAEVRKFGVLLHLSDDDRRAWLEAVMQQNDRAHLSMMREMGKSESEMLCYVFGRAHSHECTCGSIWGPCYESACEGPAVERLCPWHVEYVRTVQ